MTKNLILRAFREQSNGEGEPGRSRGISKSEAEKKPKNGRGN